MTPSKSLEQGLTIVRQRSKKAFGSQYRAEVAAVIGGLQGFWTKVDVEARLEHKVPDSSLNQEIQTFLSIGFIKRDHREESGHFAYTTQGWPEYWAAAAALVRSDLPKTREPAIRMRSRT